MMKHQCDQCPHDLTVVHFYENGERKTVRIVDLSDEELLSEYWGEAESTGRSISTDPPTPEENLRIEILSRMARRAELKDALNALTQHVRALSYWDMHPLAQVEQIGIALKGADAALAGSLAKKAEPA